MPTPRIHPPGIPTVKNLGMYVQLKATAVQLRGAGQRYRSGGVDFHKRFQGLKPPVYEAPEGEDLRKSTQPVSDNAWWFGSQMVKLSDILWHFADRAYYWETELRNVQEDAWKFVHGIEDTDGEWTRSAEKVAQNNALIGRVEAALTGRLNDEVETRKQIYALIFVSPRPPDLGQGSNGSKEMPWGSRAKPPSVLDNFIWNTSFGLPHFDALPSWANPYVRLGNPIRALAGGLLLGGLPLIWHHAEDLATGKFGSRMQKDLEALKGLAQLAVGIGTFTTPAGIAGFIMRKQMPEYLPEGFRNWMGESDKAALGFAGFDKFGEGNIAGGLGTFIANVGGLIATRKLPAGLGASVGASSLAARLGASSRFVRSVGPTGGFGRGLDAIIDAAPFRFTKEEARALEDLPTQISRRSEDLADWNAQRRSAVARADDLEGQLARAAKPFDEQREAVATSRAETRAATQRSRDLEDEIDRQSFELDQRARENAARAAEEHLPPEERSAAREKAEKEAEAGADRHQAEQAQKEKERRQADRRQQQGFDRTDRRRDARQQAVESDIKTQQGEREARTRSAERVGDAIKARARADEDIQRKARRDDFDTGRDPKHLPVAVIRELNRLKGSALSSVDLAHAKDPFEEGRPLDEAADRLQRLPGIDRDEAEDLVKRFVRARQAGVTQADIDALKRRVNGGDLEQLRRELDELARQLQ